MYTRTINPMTGAEMHKLFESILPGFEDSDMIDLEEPLAGIEENDARRMVHENYVDLDNPDGNLGYTSGKVFDFEVHFTTHDHLMDFSVYKTGDGKYVMTWQDGDYVVENCETILDVMYYVKQDFGFPILAGASNYEVSESEFVAFLNEKL